LRQTEGDQLSVRMCARKRVRWGQSDGCSQGLSGMSTEQVASALLTAPDNAEEMTAVEKSDEVMSERDPDGERRSVILSRLLDSVCDYP